MSSTIQERTLNLTDVQIAYAQTMVAESVKQIGMDMVKAILSGLSEPNLEIGALAARFIKSEWQKEVSDNDVMTQMVFKKVMTAALQHFQKHVPILMTTLGVFMSRPALHSSHESANLGVEFITAFTLPATKTMIAKIQESEHAVVLNDQTLWA